VSGKSRAGLTEAFIDRPADARLVLMVTVNSAEIFMAKTTVAKASVNWKAGAP
jgi:hypothetical protein